MQALWRPPPKLPQHHSASSLSPTILTTTFTIHPSEGLSCNPHFTCGRGSLLVFAGRPCKSRISYGVTACCYPSSGEVGFAEKVQDDGYLVRDSGWGVRRMVEEGEEMRSVAYVQAEAFHVPVALFDDFFFKFFQAEVLSALFYRVRNSPSDRYACLVAESLEAHNLTPRLPPDLVGVVDITVQRDDDVLRYLDAEGEYLYVSGIAVLKEYRRMKVGSVLLKACEVMSTIWGFKYLVLRAYEDDLAALQLYRKQGYRIVAEDPNWMTTWIGRRRRVLMIKCM